MLTKIKKWLDPDNSGAEEANAPVAREEQKVIQSNVPEHDQWEPFPRIHVEFFYFQRKAAGHQSLTQRDLDRLPVMCITVHYMEKDKAAPRWLQAMFAGLEDSLSMMNVPYLTVNEPDLYSIFADIKRDVQQIAKPAMHLLVKQLSRIRLQAAGSVTVRIHAGGDELYEDLLDAYDAEQHVP